jgi:DNA-binding NtrC family response regulator
VDLLLVSSVPATQVALVEILEGLPVNVVTAGSAERAREVLLDRAMAIVLCEEYLADGTYHDVLAQTAAWRRKIAVVVMLTSDSWNDYREALSCGAADAVRWPSRAIDVELALIRALRHRVAAMATEV